MNKTLKNKAVTQKLIILGVLVLLYFLVMKAPAY